MRVNTARTEARLERIFLLYNCPGCISWNNILRVTISRLRDLSIEILLLLLPFRLPSRARGAPRVHREYIYDITRLARNRCGDRDENNGVMVRARDISKDVYTSRAILFGVVKYIGMDAHIQVGELELNE